jgi:transcriptional regulator with XRE-family HTH domain
MSNITKLKPLRSPLDSAHEVALREKVRRRKLGITQERLATMSGVSVGSIRRFEQTGAIAFESLVRIMRALDCEDELSALFSKPAYRSIQEVIDEQREAGRPTGSRG